MTGEEMILTQRVKNLQRGLVDASTKLLHIQRQLVEAAQLDTANQIKGTIVLMTWLSKQ